MDSHCSSFHNLISCHHLHYTGAHRTDRFRYQLIRSATLELTFPSILAPVDLTPDSR